MHTDKLLYIREHITLNFTRSVDLKGLTLTECFDVEAMVQQTSARCACFSVTVLSRLTNSKSHWLNEQCQSFNL